MAGISTFNINIKDITDVAERDIATKAVEGIQSPNVISERGSISKLIDILRSSKSKEVVEIANQLGVELLRAVISAMKSAGPEIARSLTQALQTKKGVTLQSKEQKPPLTQRKERISLPSQAQTAEQRSLISSSDILMSQIQKDFINFKVNFAKSIRAQLTSSHGRAFQVIGKGEMPYTKRGGVEILKIANMDMLIGALKNLTSITEKEALTVVREKGPGALVTKASRGAMGQLISGFGKTQPVRTNQAIAKITEYINKHGYEGLNKGIQKIIGKLKPEGKDVTEQEVRKALLARKEGAKRKTVSQIDLQDLLAETAGRPYVQQHIGAAISEVAIPRPKAGLQGLPAIQMQSGRQRALTEEYRFTPGIMVAQTRAQQIVGAGGVPSATTAKIQKAVPKLPGMILKDEKAALAEHASNIMDVMKTDKKGRLELINAYRETLSAKYGKKPTQPIPEGKKAQLKYLDDLSNKAKKLSIGFDDVLVALGKLTKTGIYDRLLGTLTKEAVGVTSPMRTTMQGLGTDTGNAVKTFNKRIREVFSGQELVEPGKPRLGWYQSKTAKLNVPKLTEGGVGEPVAGKERRQELVAYNRELEKFTTMKGGKYIGSQGIGESRSVKMESDVVDKARQRMNVFTESIRDFMPLGELSNFARTIAPTYHGLGGGRTAGGKIIGGLETPLLQSEKGRAAERAGVWGKGGYGLNLQTVMADSANTFEDQIDIAGKAVNRFATYIKPKIKGVKDIGSAESVAKDIVSTFAPEMGKALHMKEPGKAVEGTALITEISKILTGPSGESLNTRAVKIVERIFTQLGTKMTTAAGSKGVVTFKTGAEGELGYTEMPTSTHELIQGMLKKRRGKVKGKGAKVEVDKAIADLDKAGTKPFVSFMHKDLPKAVQKKYKEIRDSVGKILGMDLTVSPETISSIRSMAKTELGGKAMTKKVATEVRMSLTGATKRLNLMEPLEAVVNNITGNVKAVSPKLAPKQLSQKGEVSKYLQAMGYGWGPEEKLPMEKRTLPMYTGKGAEGVIAGQKFWQYPREPAAQKEWAARDIETGRKGQKLNVAAMSALTSVFGEKSAVVQEAMGGFRPEKGRALENIMALKSFGEEPIQTKAPYISTTGMKELPGVISKYEDLRDTILDVRKFGAGGFAEIPEFEGGKEVSKKPLYIPSRESLGMYAEEGGAAGANKLATMYGSLLTNVEEYEKTKTREYPKGEKANVDILRKNVKGQIGKTSSDLRKMLGTVTRGERSAISGEDLKNLINYFKKLQVILEQARLAEDPGLKQMAIPAGKLMERISGGVGKLEKISGTGKGVTKKEIYGKEGLNSLLMAVKDSLLEPKLDTKKIERIQSDLKKVKTGKPLTDISSESYYFHKKATETWKKKEFTPADFESDAPEMSKKVRSWVSNSLKSYLGTLTVGKGKPGLLSTSEGALGVAAKQFGVTTEPKQQALEERQKAIERDKYRLKKELVSSTIGSKKGAEILQTRTIPAISGTLSAAINSKVEDFKEAAKIISGLSERNVLGDPSDVKSLGNTLVNSVITQSEKHGAAVEKERKAGRIVLREGEVGLPAAKLEKLTGDYGAVGKNLLEATRVGKDISVMTTRFPMTGLASHQFAKAREITHPGGRNIISLPGAAPGIDVSEMEKIRGQLKERQVALREERAALPEAKIGTAVSKQLDAQRASLTKNILELSKAIDLVTVKFSGFAQNADIDGDTLMVHAGKTKAAQKEIAGVARAHRTGVYGGVGTRDPRAFINQMMNYNIKKQTSSMAELTDLYTTRAKLPVAKLFQTPEITREMKGVSIDKVMEGLKSFGVTSEKIADITKAKGLTGLEGRETVARETLYEKTRAQQYGKLYVKTGLGESTEAISRVARFIESSVGFGEKQISKKEYAAWKPESVALGAVYGKGGVLTQKAKPGREMQTMMNVLLEQVINQAMSAKHGGKAAFQEVTQGLASGTLFKTMQGDIKLPKKDQRFKGILEANEIIKTIIRDRLDALNAVDFAAEAKRHKTSGKGRAAITNELVNQFSFEGFLGATTEDIQNQILKTTKTPKQAKGVKRQIAKGELDLGMYFPQMQPEYALRTSSASIEKLAKQTEKGKTTLDKAITRVLGILKSTGTSTSVSDVMMQGAFENMFNLFKKAEGLGVNLEKIFAGAKTAKTKRRTVGGLERMLGMPTMGAAEKMMVKEEGAERFRKKYPKADEKDIAKFQEEYLFKTRKTAIEQHVAAAETKKQFMMGIVPTIGMPMEQRRIEEAKYAKFTRRKKMEREKVIPPKGPLMLSPGYGYVPEPDVPYIGTPPSTLRETLHGVKQGQKGKVDVVGGLNEQESKLVEAMAALRGGAKGKDYAALTESQTNEMVKTLQRYTEALNLLLESASTLTITQTAKIQKALSFIKQNVGTLAAVPAGTKLGATAKSAVSAFKTVRAEGLEDFAARLGVSAEKQLPTGIPIRAPLPTETKKPVFTGKYKTELEALQGFVAAARKRTGYSPEGKSERIQELLAAVRKEPSSAADRAQELMKETYEEEKGGRLPKEKGVTVWRQYHLEKVRGELDKAMAAEAAGSIYHREEAVDRAKGIIRTGYERKATPFLTRAEGGRGRVTGYADEEAASMLGLFRMPTAVEDIGKRISKKSKTAGAAAAPVLFGVGRMEERLKVMWARIREFKPELAKAGKAFNFDNAQADLAIIRDELKGFKFFGDFSSEEAADIDHAISKVTKMQKTVQEAPKKALPTLAIPELETTETATAAFENLIAANVKEMEAQKDLAVGETRKVVAKIPTAEGQIEKRQVTLTARGAKGGIIAPGVVGGIERVEGKPTVMQKEWGPSRRSVRLLQEFSASTDSINKKVQQVWLGIKRFDKAAGTVDFSEALEDLTSMQMLIAEMLKSPLVTPKQFGELSQLKRQLAPAARAVAGTPAEAMKTVMVKGMETPESAKAAFREQIEAQKAAFLEQENLAIGQKISVAAALPTKQGVMQKKKVQLTAVGEKGVVTDIEEQEFKPVKQYVEDLVSKKPSRGAGLINEFVKSTGAANTRISTLLLGVKKFDKSLVKAGEYSKAINFDNAEKDLVEIMTLLNTILKGAATLTEEERAIYKQAQLAAKAMYQKVVKTPITARKGISMGGYETPESSLAAHRARMEQGKLELAQANEIGKSMVIKSRLMTKSGEETSISKRLTARGSRFFGLGGPVTQKTVKEREEVGGGQVGSVIRRVAMWGAASGVVYGIIGGVKQMLQTMTQAETGMVNLKKVMSHVTTNFDNMRDSAVRFAKDYGAELMGVLETMRIFAQQGLPQEQVTEMARVSTLAANVTTMKPPEAAEALTSATRQFNIEGEKSIAILDSWNEVENKFAITAKDLADGFKKAGTAAKITGIDVHKLNGIITAIGEATRQTGKEVGTSLKFIFSRMATEKAPRAMRAVGVETMEGGKLREGSAILDDLAVKWVTLTRSQKLATAQAIGGIRHYNALMVLMDNYDRALAATAASTNSVGSAEKENKMIMETYAKKVAQMKASIDALAVSASGPVLSALGKFTIALKSVIDILALIPGGGLAAGGALAYGAATSLGKYFDLSMFGLLGSSVGGAKRKRKTLPEIFKSTFGGKTGIGRDVIATSLMGKTLGMEPSKGAKELIWAKREEARRIEWTKKDIATRSMGRSGGVSLGPQKTVGLVARDKIAAGFKKIGTGAKTATLSTIGLLASLGTFAKVAILISAVVLTFKALGASISKTFASAKERTKDYTKSLDVVEERLSSIGNIKLLRKRIEIVAEKRGALAARTPEQRVAQIEGRSYESPILMRKQQIASVKEYASAVAAMTNKGIIGFDKFGKAIISSTDKLGNVVDELEAVGSKARLDLKLHIEKEELEDLIKAPEIDNWIKSIHLKFRTMLESLSKYPGGNWLGKYADKMRNPFEAVLHSIEEINKLQREAGSYGETIAPPRAELEKEDPKKYKRTKKRFDEYTKAQAERLVATKAINEKFLETRRDFFTLAGPGMTTEGAGQAAFGQTGRLLAEIERQRESRFYTERGASTEDIQASFFQRLQGVNVRATAEITREAAAEQGIPFRAAGVPVERREMLAGARTKDILMFEKQAGIQGDMASVFEKNGELWVRYSEQIVEGTKTQLVAAEKTLAQFKEIPEYAKYFVGIVSSMGMLTPVQMRLRAISRVSAGAEAGMFRPQKSRKLDLGKKYTYQVPTEMLIQNDAFKTFSKTTTSFVNEYIKKQNDLREQQKAALSVYEKRGAIAGETATRIELLTAELVKLSNVAMQSIRIHVELEKALDQVNISSKKQADTQKFRSENLKHLTGPLAGTPILRVPKIDLRSPSDLIPHEYLARTDKNYVSNVQKLNKTMDEYNVEVKKGELSTQALTDIAYVEEMAGKGVDFGDITELSKKISKTGDLGSASLLTESEKQTSLLQQATGSLSTLVGLSGGSASAYAKVMEKPGGINKDIEMKGVLSGVQAEASSLLVQGKYEEFTNLRNTLEKTNKASAEKKQKEKEKVEQKTFFGMIIPENMVRSSYQSETKKPEETLDYLLPQQAVEETMVKTFQGLLSTHPEKMKDILIGSGAVKNEEEYKKKASKGELGEVIRGYTSGKRNIVALLDYIESSTNSFKNIAIFSGQLEDLLGSMSNPTSANIYGKNYLGGVNIPKTPAKTTKENFGGPLENILVMDEKTPAKTAKEESIAGIKAALTGSEKKIVSLAKTITGLVLPLESAQKAVKNFRKASGQLEKSVEYLVDSFRDLERQSVINKKLIETRSEYLSTRGGPMRQRAPSVDIDVATTAQYSPHELLYNRDRQYKNTVTEYLKTAESLKAARSKVEEVVKIQGKAEYMKDQGISEERISGIINTALITGSMESALMVTEQEKTNGLLETVNNSILGVSEKEGKKPGITGENKGIDGYKSLKKIKKEQELKAKYAEQENIEQAEYLRKEQVRMQTAKDIAAGRGETQDQVNREESELLTEFGYVPTEIKDRNKQLVKTHKEEKAAREKWERAKQESLKPLQQSAGGMQSLIDSIKSGVAGIKGARNIRPLKRDFDKWVERQGPAKERIADQSMQFDLARNLYSQNLNLRAQGADTGVDPRSLYDIMKSASKGEDVTNELEQIQSSLEGKKKEKEEQIRKIQAEEYARAVKEVVTPHDEKLGTIGANTGKLITTMVDAGRSIVDAVNSSSKKTTEVHITEKIPITKPGSKQSRVRESIQKKAGESVVESVQKIEPKPEYVYTGVGSGDITKVPSRGYEFGKPVFFNKLDEKATVMEKSKVAYEERRRNERTKASPRSYMQSEAIAKFDEDSKIKNTQEAMKAGLTITPVSENAKRIYANPDVKLYEDMTNRIPITADKQLVTDREKAVTMLDEVNQMISIPRKDKLIPTKNVSEEKQIEFNKSGLKQKTREDKKVGKEQIKETKNVNNEMSDFKDGLLTLNTAVSDVNKGLEEFSKDLDKVNKLEDTSKGSSEAIEALGKSASDASSSLSTLSTKMDNVKLPETVAGTGPTMKNEEGYEYISEDSDVVKDLVDKTDGLAVDVDSIERSIANMPDNSEVITELVDKTNNIKDKVDLIPDNSGIITELINKTGGLAVDIDNIEQNMLELSEGLVTTESFSDFKKEISSYFEEINGLKTSIEDLNKDMILNNNYTVESKKQFEIIIDRLQTYDTEFTKIERDISFMDHKFTDAIAELHEMVCEAMDLARSAYNFASQAINQT